MLTWLDLGLITQLCCDMVVAVQADTPPFPTCHLIIHDIKFYFSKATHPCFTKLHFVMLFGQILNKNSVPCKVGGKLLIQDSNLP